MKKFTSAKAMSCHSGFLTKTIVFMKLGLLLLFGFTLQVAAKGYSQGDVKISLHLTDVNLVKALAVIERKSGYRIFYSDNDLPAASKVTVHLEDRLLPDVLSKVLSETGLIYKIKFYQSFYHFMNRLRLKKKRKFRLFWFWICRLFPMRK